MSLFKKKSSYSYYGGYNSGRGRLRKDRVIMAAIAGAVLLTAILVVINLTRIKLMFKGYSYGEASEILTLTKAQEKEILSFDKMDHISEWIKESNNVSYYYNYERYLEYKPKMEYADVVIYVDDVFSDKVPKLTSLGYSDDVIWQLLKKASTEDLQYLIDKNLNANTVENYRKVSGYKIQNTEKYIEAYKEYNDYNYAVNIVNYPFILSTNEVDTEYLIKDPENILALVKKGFFLPSDYEPSDLTTPNIPISPDCEDSQVRKDASDALEELAAAAKKENYFLVLNSAYRSYDRQVAIYQEFENKYGGLYAAEYVATPGASEHQTGLGIDLTSQSVLDGTRLVFGDTDEYKWVIKNAHKYGFIVRFETETADITGIAHEPWHLRYVGKDVAKEIYDNNWTLEEYCLYKSVLPKLSEK